MNTEYQKIHTVWKRDERGRVLAGEYSCPEFGYLAELDWLWTEKVDGTNIRLHYDGTENFRANTHAYVAGRTDNAQLPPKLLSVLMAIMNDAPFETLFGDGSADVTLYGEGYGANVQRGGGKYNPDGCDFVLFDVKIGNWWLMRSDVEEIAAKLGLDVVPIIGTGPLQAAIELVAQGFPSARWPGVDIAEGLVCRPQVELTDRGGRRILTKIKHKDFRR